jgi:hypothetical protein
MVDGFFDTIPQKFLWDQFPPSAKLYRMTGFALTDERR